ncbi:MAG TPA: ribose-phosphate pyrophosphokinase [Candidatus Dormibacteraeota bacterium]|nr:ribose-phosphate pyrophosphokinase [Candidatus Dormibacteraeota bacterium]
MFGDLKLLSGNAHPELAAAIAAELKVKVGDMQLTRFSDGEYDVKIAESVRGLDVFVIQPTCQPVSENLIQLFIILDALHRASAARVTAVIPYYGYARKEKKTAPRDPISAKLMANVITLAGANRVIALDLHADAIQGFFDIPFDHLTAQKILAQHIRQRHLGDIVVVSPDVGGTRRARDIARLIDAPLAIVEKRRPRDDVTEVLNVIGEVEGMNAVVVDDLISTGRTLVGVANALVASGARTVDVMATHGIFSDGAVERLAAAPIDQIVVTDSIPHPAQHEKLMRLSVAPLLAEGISRVHEDRSVSELFG